MAKKKKQPTAYDLDPGAFLSKPSGGNYPGGSPDLWQQFVQAIEQYPGTIAGDFKSLGGSGGKQQAPKQAQVTSDPQSKNPLADFLIGKIPDMTYGELNNPSPQWLQTMSHALSSMSPGDAQKVLSALPQNSPAFSQLQTLLKPSSQQQLYGFDPLSIANVYQQVFSPAIKYAQQQYSGDIANYGKMMQQALKGASPQYQQAYAVSMPGLQEAMQMQAAGMQSQISSGAATDAIIQNLTNATNAAKAAQQYASIAPYYQSLVQGQGGLIGGAGVGGAATSGASPAPMTTPFTYGSPNASQLGVLQAQQALMGLANMAATGQ